MRNENNKVSLCGTVEYLKEGTTKGGKNFCLITVLTEEDYPQRIPCNIWEEAFSLYVKEEVSKNCLVSITGRLKSRPNVEGKGSIVSVNVEGIKNLTPALSEKV